MRAFAFTISSVISLMLMSFLMPSQSTRWTGFSELDRSSFPLMSVTSVLLTNTITNTLSLTCADIDDFDFEFVPTSLLPGDTTYLEYGVPSEQELILHVNTVVTEPVSQTNYVVSQLEVLSATGLPSNIEALYPTETILPATQECIPLEGAPLETGLFELELQCTIVISIFGNPFTLNNFVFSHWVRVLPNTNGIPGCIYAFAGNYNPIATYDDGSCVEAGCLDPEAANFSPGAVVEDGSCIYCDGSGGNVCPEDLNGDGAVNAGDLLALLATFGSPC